MSARVRRVGYPSWAPAPVAALEDLLRLKSHPLYCMAKSGDASAAFQVVADRMPRSLLYELRRVLPMNPWLVPAISMERRGCNALPIAMAHYLAEGLGGRVWLDTIQCNKAWHTGADMMERLVRRPLFDGKAPRDAPCVLVDDVSTVGSTLAELSDHLLQRDAEVAGSVLMVNASRSALLCPDQRIVGLVSDRFGAVIEDELAIHPAALTRDEANYLVGFRSADELRKRAATARSTLDQRAASAPASPDCPDERPRPRPDAFELRPA